MLKHQPLALLTACPKRG
jgi:hypothetical protein